MRRSLLPLPLCLALAAGAAIFFSLRIVAPAAFAIPNAPPPLVQSPRA